MANTPYLTAPLKMTTMPPGIPYIIGNEAAERFSFYGMRAILYVYIVGLYMNLRGLSVSGADRWAVGDSGHRRQLMP